MKSHYFTPVLCTICILSFSGLIAQSVTLIIQPGPVDGKDALIRDDYLNTPIPSDVNLTSNAWTVDGFPCILRSLIEFDLTPVPIYAVVKSATLSLYCNIYSGYYQLQSGDNQSYLLRVIQSWNQNTVTWNTQPATTMQNKVLLSTSTSNTQDYPEIDVTAQVQDMVANPASNFGWMLQLVTEELYASMVFASSDNPVSLWRPKLTVNYCTSFTAAFTYKVYDTYVEFTDHSDTAYSWYWNFGDGYFSNLQNPVHAYGEPGKYLCCLTITGSCGTSTYCDTVFFCNNPNPRYTYSPEGHFIIFSDSSELANSWYWNFGDGFYSDLQNPIHYFDHFGTYFVCLTATNTCKQETFCDSVTVVPNGIYEIDDPGINLHPNPARDHFVLSIPNMFFYQELNMMIYNMQGLLLRNIEKLSTGSMDEITVDISDLPCGVYYLKIRMKNETMVKKFIKI